MAGCTPPTQASQPASQQHTPMYSRLFVVVVSHIYYYIYMLHITDRQTEIDRSLSILSLSLYIVLVLVACTLSHPPPHDSRRACVYACMCVHLAPFRAMLQTSR